MKPKMAEAWKDYGGEDIGVDLLFIDSLTGLIAESSCRIFKTIDGGNSWFVTNINGLNDTLGIISKIFFINTNIGWAVTSRGGIL